MDDDDKQTIEDIESILKKRKIQKKKVVSHPVVSTEEIARSVVGELLQQLNKGSPGPAATPGLYNVPPATPGGPAAVPAMDPKPQLTPSEEKFKTAQLAMSLSKNISILCMLVFILPIISVLVTMMNLEMVALVISMVAMIYPAFLFVKSLGMQTYLSRKYGLKPLMRMQQQQMMPAQQPMMPQVPYGLSNKPNQQQQQRKQNQEMF